MGRVGGTVVEIACDESGFSGSNLLDGATPLFTHASVDLSVDEAFALMDDVRSGVRWSVDELKAGQFLRSPHAEGAMASLVAALDGRAHVHLIDKEYFLATRVVDLFLVEPSYAAGTRLTERNRPAALALHRARRGRASEWADFLAAFVELVRTKRRREPDLGLLDRFLRARDELAVGSGSPAAAVLAELDRERVLHVVTRLVHGDRAIPPPLEPLLPALAETVLFWGCGRRRVLVVHDEQSALTAYRLTRLQEALTDGHAPTAGGRDTRGPGRTPSVLAGLVTVDSRDDPRVQVADLLAGLARRSAPAARGALLGPFLSPTSLLGDEP